MNPYKVLGVRKNAKDATIKKAYRQLSKAYHPDAGGDRAKFEEVKLAFDILIDPSRRKRYDTTGRLDSSPVTRERVNEMIRSSVIGIINGPRSGLMDDPVWTDIKTKVLLSIEEGRYSIQNNRAETQRKLERVTRLLERFKSKTDEDPIGDALREQKKFLEEETLQHQDAMEMSIELERILKDYDYEVEPGPEGRYSPGPPQRRGTMFLSNNPKDPFSFRELP